MGSRSIAVPPLGLGGVIALLVILEGILMLVGVVPVSNGSVAAGLIGLGLARLT